MATEWFYESGGKQLGPVSPSELSTLAASGQIVSETLIWKEGLADWVQAKKVKGLFPAASPAIVAQATPKKLPRITPVTISHDEPMSPASPRSRRQKISNPVKIVVVGVVAFSALSALMIYGMSGNGKDSLHPIQIVFGLVVLIGIACLYLLPTIIAKVRGHQNFMPITALNVLLGLSGIGWVIALIWSLSEVRPKEIVHRHYHDGSRLFHETGLESPPKLAVGTEGERCSSAVSLT